MGTTWLRASSISQWPEPLTTTGQNALVVANGLTWFESGGDTILQLDVNGDTTADMTIVLKGTGLGLGAADFNL